GDRGAEPLGGSPSLWSHLWHHSPTVRQILKLQITVLALLSLLHFVANDVPFVVRYKGLFLFPVLRSYPETRFGADFETAADYRVPYTAKPIAEVGGYMFWPPIRYSYNTHNLDPPTASPSPPTWVLTEEQCKSVVAQKGLNGCSDLEYNWLGTDDRGR